jgi:hypothetical protein
MALRGRQLQESAGGTTIDEKKRQAFTVRLVEAWQLNMKNSRLFV